MADTHHRRASPRVRRIDHRTISKFLFVFLFLRRPPRGCHRCRQRPSGEESGEDEYQVTPMFVSIHPSMKLTDHDGREA